MLFRSANDIEIELQLQDRAGRVQIMGARPFVARNDSLAQTAVLIELPPSQTPSSDEKIRLQLKAGGRRAFNLATGFVGPRR